MTYNINDPLYKQMGLDEAITMPYQKFLDGLVTGRMINIIAPGDFNRHVQRTVSVLLRLKEQQKGVYNPKVKAG
jgi:hypothetical protein